MHKIRSPRLFVALLIAAASSICAEDPAAIQKKLESQYALTQPTADNTDIVTAGAILVLKKSNLMMAPVSSSNLYQNTYKDGKISQNALGSTLKGLGRLSHLPGASPSGAPETRTYVTGEKMWVTKISVKDDGVIFDLLTDAIADVRYKGSLKLVFAKGSKPSADQVDSLVAEVFKVQPADDAKSNPPEQAPKGAQAPGGQGGAAEAPPAPIAPPPPPADAAPAPIPPPPPPADEQQAPPKTLSLGLTTDQVVAILGQPQKIVKLPNKETYYYKDLKVTFTAGKVTDIQ